MEVREGGSVVVVDDLIRFVGLGFVGVVILELVFVLLCWLEVDIVFCENEFVVLVLVVFVLVVDDLFRFEVIVGDCVEVVDGGLFFVCVFVVDVFGLFDVVLIGMLVDFIGVEELEGLMLRL